jgi:hypothetical protein
MFTVFKSDEESITLDQYILAKNQERLEGGQAASNAPAAGEAGALTLEAFEAVALAEQLAGDMEMAQDLQWGEECAAQNQARKRKAETDAQIEMDKSIANLVRINLEYDVAMQRLNQIERDRVLAKQVEQGSLPAVPAMAGWTRFARDDEDREDKTFLAFPASVSDPSDAPSAPPAASWIHKFSSDKEEDVLVSLLASAPPAASWIHKFSSDKEEEDILAILASARPASAKQPWIYMFNGEEAFDV